MKSAASPANRPYVVGLFTEVMFPGGIQRVSHTIAATLAEFARERGVEYRLVSLNDPVGQHDLTLNGTTFKLHGSGRNKRLFFMSALRLASAAQMVHVNHPNLGPLALLMKVLHPALRYAVTTHGIDAWKRLPFLRRQGVCRATWITAPSQYTANKLIAAQGAAPSKVAVIPWGIDLNGLRRPESRMPPPGFPEGKVLLTVARLAKTERFKRVEEVIAAMPEILKAVPEARYVVVGGGNERARFEAQVRELGLEGRVLLPGVCSDEVLAQHYHACDVFVMLSSKEGFGLVYVEAMAFGKAVVASPESAVPEIVLDGETGLMVDPQKPQELAQAVIRLLKDDNLRSRMGAAGKARAEALYSLPGFQQRFTSFLSSLDTGQVETVAALRRGPTESA